MIDPTPLELTPGIWFPRERGNDKIRPKTYEWVACLISYPPTFVGVYLACQGPFWFGRWTLQFPFTLPLFPYLFRDPKAYDFASKVQQRLEQKVWTPGWGCTTTTDMQIWRNLPCDIFLSWCILAMHHFLFYHILESGTRLKIDISINWGLQTDLTIQQGSTISSFYTKNSNPQSHHFIKAHWSVMLLTA